MIESILLNAVPIATYAGRKHLTNATGFFFERDAWTFLVTSRHVLVDEPSDHFPDRVAIELHTDPQNVAKTTGFSIPLYGGGRSLWRQGRDAAGGIDVAAIEIDRSALPETAVFWCFTPHHLLSGHERIEIGSALLILGFPLGFHDQLHRLPVARQAIVASSFGLRFQGEGYFMTDARTHRGSSGSPVVMRAAQPEADDFDLPWKLLGVHSSRVDVSGRESNEDEALGLNCAWYADILLTLTEG
jgi:hypothetical protein